VLGDVSGAEFDFGAMLSLVPNPDALPNTFDRDAWRFARARLGWLYLDKSNQLAERQFDEILKTSPDSAEAYAGRGYARAATNKLSEAARDAETAIEKLNANRDGEKGTASEPTKVLYYVAAVYGAIHARSDDPDAAQKNALKAIESLSDAVASLGGTERAQRLAMAQKDEAFRSLHELPEWKRLMAQLDASK
jgi:tetratricopeptide (TPR) repeat protein